MAWEPSKYLRFGGVRLRPAIDLLRRAESMAGNHVVTRVLDLGAGAGTVTPAIRATWPKAQIVCTDNSESMMASAKKLHAEQSLQNIAYELASFDGFEGKGEEYDVIFSNAALHWATGHETLFPKLMACLKPGGVLAVQMPDTRKQPSHLLMETAAANLGFSHLLSGVRIPRCEKDADFYYGILDAQSSEIDAWTTSYLHVLEGDCPVADMTRSTGQLPVLEAMGGPESERGKAFTAEYRKLVSEAYPRRADGKTLFSFTRFFLVARRKESTA